jgi:hypothetical protein
MKIGCGCGLFLLVLGLGLVGAGWATLKMLQGPGLAPADLPSAGTRGIEEKVDRLAPSGGPGSSRRHTTLTFSQAELGAFLARQVGDATDLSISELRVVLPEANVAEIAARVRVRDVLKEPPLAAATHVLPQSWLERPVWLHLRGTARLEPETTGRKRFLRIDVQQFWIGRQRLPAIVPRLILDPGALRILRWPLPRGVEDVTIEKGRVIVRAAS